MSIMFNLYKSFFPLVHASSSSSALKTQSYPTIQRISHKCIFSYMLCLFCTAFLFFVFAFVLNSYILFIYFAPLWYKISFSENYIFIPANCWFAWNFTKLPSESSSHNTIHSNVEPKFSSSRLPLLEITGHGKLFLTSLVLYSPPHFKSYNHNFIFPIYQMLK